jgi:hypothetical protein
MENVRMDTEIRAIIKHGQGAKRNAGTVFSVSLKRRDGLFRFIISQKKAGNSAFLPHSKTSGRFSGFTGVKR